jgi:Zn-finger nucleic acid-binding protein
MEAQSLHCPNCGATAAAEAPACQHCGAHLATVACPACFGMMFQGTKFCPQCGTPAVEWQRDVAELWCPDCEIRLLEGTLGGIRLNECGKCYGLWLDPNSFDALCRSTEQRSADFGSARWLPPKSTPGSDPVQYRHCPVCRQFMNRVNFARCSGVVLDVCRGHGIWFDRQELQRIVQFIEAGGLNQARELEKARLTEEVRRLEEAKNQVNPDNPYGPRSHSEVSLLSLVGRAVSDLMDRWRQP